MLYKSFTDNHLYFCGGCCYADNYRLCLLQEMIFQETLLGKLTCVNVQMMSGFNVPPTAVVHITLEAIVDPVSWWPNIWLPCGYTCTAVVIRAV